MTVEEIAERLAKAGVKVGLTTIYRTVNLLEAENALVKIPAADGNGALYRYVADSAEESPYGKLQCRDCGRSSNLDCSHLNELIEHIEHDHHFQVSKPQTMFYGLCEKCSEADGRENKDV